MGDAVAAADGQERPVDLRPALLGEADRHGGQDPGGGFAARPAAAGLHRVGVLSGQQCVHLVDHGVEDTRLHPQFEREPREDTAVARHEPLPVVQSAVVGADGVAAAALLGRVVPVAARLGQLDRPAGREGLVGGGDVPDDDGRGHPVRHQVVAGEVQGRGLLADHRPHDEPGSAERVGSLEEPVHVVAGCGGGGDGAHVDGVEFDLLGVQDSDVQALGGLLEHPPQHLVAPHEVQQRVVERRAVEPPPDLERSAEVGGAGDVLLLHVAGDGEVLVLDVGGGAALRSGVRVAAVRREGDRPFHGVPGRDPQLVDGNLEHNGLSCGRLPCGWRALGHRGRQEPKGLGAGRLAGAGRSVVPGARRLTRTRDGVRSRTAHP